MYRNKLKGLYLFVLFAFGKDYLGGAYEFVIEHLAFDVVVDDPHFLRVELHGRDYFPGSSFVFFLVQLNRESIPRAVPFGIQSDPEPLHLLRLQVSIEQ